LRGMRYKKQFLVACRGVWGRVRSCPRLAHASEDPPVQATACKPTPSRAHPHLHAVRVARRRRSGRLRLRPPAALLLLLLRQPGLGVKGRHQRGAAEAASAGEDALQRHQLPLLGVAGFWECRSLHRFD
jgi:hypothetical protein